MQIAQALRSGNPHSWFFGRTAAIALYRSAVFAQGAGDQTLLIQRLSECHDILKRARAGGVELDAGMKQMLASLEGMFGR